MVKYIVIISLLVVYCKSKTVTVVTSIGAIQGDSHDGYNTFLGIPYAKVDEDNPFGSSRTWKKFETTYIANDSSVICPQVYFNDNGIIQCLRLHIYVPQKANVHSCLPIFVWFHGGGFAFGSAGEYGGQYLVKQDIIVITVNYRLGAYGFLCLNDPSVPGNQGMKDQIMALRWIKKHIASFGGDASKITIAGESYGGVAVDSHLYSKYETLFDKSIIQSGSIYITEAVFVKPDYNAAIKLASYLGNNVTTTKEALKVLAKTSPVDVNAATRNLGMILTLCKEKKFKGVQNFLTEVPFYLNNPDRIKKTPILIGYTSQEALYLFANKLQSFYDELGNVIAKQLKETFVLKKRDVKRLSKIIKYFYLGGKAIGPDAQLELSDFVSDFALNFGVEMSVNRYMKQRTKVYKYLFSYIGASEYKNVTGSGASHTEELKYLFDLAGATPLSGAEQLMMRERMITMWANFVKYGNPTPRRTSLLPVTWELMTYSTRPYLNIDVNMEMKEHVFQKRMGFWNLFWNIYLKRHVLLN